MISSATALSERDPRRGGSRRIVRSHGVEDVVRVGVAVGDSGGHSCESVVCVIVNDGRGNCFKDDELGMRRKEGNDEWTIIEIGRWWSIYPS